MLGEHVGEVALRVGEGGSEPDRLAILRRRFVEAALGGKRVAEIAVRLCRRRREANRLFEVGARGLAPTERREHDPEIAVDVRVAGLEAERILELGQRFVRAALLMQPQAEADVPSTPTGSGDHVAPQHLLVGVDRGLAPGGTASTVNDRRERRPSWCRRRALPRRT